MTKGAYVTESRVEIEYIYPSQDANEWVLALYWWEGDTKADVHTYDGRIVGQWKYPDATNFTASDHIDEILSKFGEFTHER